MWAYVLLNFIASILCVALIHYLWNYFRDKYTVKKTRDIVGAQTEKYKEMMAEILNSQSQRLPLSDKSPSLPQPEYISPEDKEIMLRELRLLLIQ